jgi:hypothetical protein
LYKKNKEQIERLTAQDAKLKEEFKVVREKAALATALAHETGILSKFYGFLD